MAGVGKSKTKKIERDFNSELQDYFSAGYSCLFIRTVSPHLAEEAVRQAMISLGFGLVEFGVWKVNTGLLTGPASQWGRERFKPRINKIDLEQAIELVGERKLENPIVIVFHHLRQYIDSPDVIQALIDSSVASRSKGSHMVIVGSHCEVPVELRNFVTFLDFPLPTREEIFDRFTAMADHYANEITLPKKKSRKESLLRRAANAALGLDAMGAENSMSLSLISTRKIDLGVIQRQKEQEVRKSDVLEFFPNYESMDNLGGYNALKEWLTKRKSAFTDEARNYGLKYPKGILIVGPAGCGKSLAAKATADYLGLPLLRWDMGKIYRKYVGESEASTRMALQVAEAVSPCVLWIDEIEKGLAGMRSSGELDSGVTSRVVSTILTWRQETEYPVFLCATSNDVSTLPSMVYRPGRMDQVWSTDLPNAKERKEIFSIHIRKRNRNSDNYNLDLLSRKAEDFTGAEIEFCIDDAMYSAFSERVEFTDEHILEAIDVMVPQSQRDSEELESIRKWAENKTRSVSITTDTDRKGGSGQRGQGERILRMTNKKKKGGA